MGVAPQADNWEPTSRIVAESGTCGARPGDSTRLDLVAFPAMAKKKSPKMTAARRRNLPAAKMGLPEKGKYPVDTPERAANAKARVAQALRKGEITEADAKKVIAKADKALGGGKKKKAARKGATEIVSGAKKASGGKLPKTKAAARKPNPAMAAKRRK